MQIAALASPRTRESPIRANIAALIDSISTPEFDGRLFGVMREAVRCEHLSAFAYSPSVAPRVIAAGSARDHSVARVVGEAYVADCWKRDPLPRMFETEPQGNVVTVRVDSEEMRKFPHRRECYSRFGWKDTGAKLIDRFSIVTRHQSELFCVNFYRHADDGMFSPKDLTEISSSSDIIFALLRKHKPAAAPKNIEEARRQYEQQLRAIVPSLSSREVQVCTGIALGMTSEAIGSVLGISTHTVLTYRKRAYARMQICSQNELLRLMFTAPG